MTATPIDVRASILCRSKAWAAQCSRQGGATLVTTLVLLALIGLAAMISYSVVIRNAKVVGNMQLRTEAIAAAQDVIEQTISSSVFTRDPGAVASTRRTIDIDGNGTPDYTVALTPEPTCLWSRTIRIESLDPDRPEDLACLGSSGVSAGEDFLNVAQGRSLCRESLWDVTAVVTDTATGATATVHQGVSVRVSAAEGQNACR